MDKAFWNKTEALVLSRLAPQLRGGQLFADLDGKIRLKKKLSMDVPWIFVGGRDFGDCYVYHQVYFDIFGIIPSFCQYFCWKVVLRPTTLRDMFGLLDTFKSLELPSKVGIETRHYVPGQYSAYIYADSQEDGQAKYDLITREAPHIPAILKRGCTEFELQKPSSEWGCDPQQQEIEKFLMTIFNPDPIPVFQPTWVKNHIKREWIYQAWKNNDETYKEFIPEEDWQLFPKAIQYQNVPTLEDMEPIEPEVANAE